MNWNAKMFAYCERGTDPAFWAEPLNAVSNFAFIVAALLALRFWVAKRNAPNGVPELGLILLVVAVGAGSFLFHTFATRWAMLADTLPIGIFMLAYLCYAIRRFAGASWIATGFSIALFLAAGAGLESISCDGGRCLNGSLGYVPALAAMMIIGGALQTTEHPAAGPVFSAAGVFAASLVFRSVDWLVCPSTLIQPGWRTGTHAVWHVLNATVLYLLLRAAVLYGSVIARRAEN